MPQRAVLLRCDVVLSREENFVKRAIVTGKVHNKDLPDAQSDALEFEEPYHVEKARERCRSIAAANLANLWRYG